MTNSNEPPAQKRWHTVVDVKSDQDLKSGASSRIVDAIDEIAECNAIMDTPDGWVAFVFTIEADNALDALVDALRLVRAIWEEWTCVPLPEMLEVHTTVTEDRHGHESLDPDRRIRTWVESMPDASAPSTTVN